MTREEIIQAISDDKMMHFIQSEQLAQIVAFVINNYQPSLPSGLDEAAEKAYKEYDVKAAVKPKEYPVGFLFFDGFKAGAEWMAGQGVTEEYEVDEDGIFLDSDSLGICLMAWPPSELGCKEGDILVIQMRKKQ